jgi:hypothetical protein
MLLDILLEILEFLGFISLKKKKKKRNESTSPETNGPTQERDRSLGVPQGGIIVCAGCNRILDKDVVYELGKTWCPECYKSHVLKIRG